eukprot:Hpha_TRINITY_DN16971_c1_g1::TRINITY_DN16971_c1_g1_i4::g.54692::m.54692
MHTAVGRISGEISSRPLKGDRLTNKYFTSRVPNAILLDHGTQCEVAPGLWAAGVPWCPWHKASDRDNGHLGKPHSEYGQHQLKIWKYFATTFENPHRYDDIPEGVDILVQHMPIAGILDRLAPMLAFVRYGVRWSPEEPPPAPAPLVEKPIEVLVPSAVFHGHIHEQNGCFARASDGSWGAGPGVCYPPAGLASDKVRTVECPRPEPSFGVGVGSLMQMIVNGANSNLPYYDGHSKHICMPPRFILARRVSRADGTKGKWIFSLATH